MERKFKVGDKVKTYCGIGELLWIDEDKIGVGFKNSIRFGHDLGIVSDHNEKLKNLIIEKGYEGKCWWFFEKELELIEESDEKAIELEDLKKMIREAETFEGNEPVKEADPIKPAHYNQGKFECIDEMIILFGKEAVIGFCKCNIYKYKTRASMKNGKEDLEKADRYIELLEEKFGICVETECVW